MVFSFRESYPRGEGTKIHAAIFSKFRHSNDKTNPTRSCDRILYQASHFKKREETHQLTHILRSKRKRCAACLLLRSFDTFSRYLIHRRGCRHHRWVVIGAIVVRSHVWLYSSSWYNRVCLERSHAQNLTSPRAGDVPRHTCVNNPNKHEGQKSALFHAQSSHSIMPFVSTIATLHSSLLYFFCSKPKTTRQFI